MPIESVFPTKGKCADRVQNYNALFPSRLRKLREDSGHSQNEFATAIGVTRSTVSLYESGVNLPDVETFSRIADFYNVSFDFLLGRSDCKKSENNNIHEETGLSEKAIGQLRDYYETYSNSLLNMAFLNEFIGNNRFMELLCKFSDVFTTYANLKALEDQNYLQRKADKEIEQEKNEFGCISVEINGWREGVNAGEITNKDMDNARALKKTDILEKGKNDYQFSVWQAQEIVKELMQDNVQKIYPAVLQALQKEGSKHGDDSKAGQ